MTDPDEERTPAFRNDAELPPPPFPGSHMVIDDDYVFVSGLVAADALMRVLPAIPTGLTMAASPEPGWCRISGATRA